VLGYPNSSVTTVVEGGSVRFEIETGVKVLVGKIIVQGNKVTHDHVILKEIRLQEGATWNPASLEAASERLLRTGLFAGVTLQPADGVLDGAVEDLAVTVEERDTGTFNLETTFNTEDGLHLNGEVTQRNFRGEGDSITLGVDGFYRSGERFLDAGRARAMYGERAFLGTDLRFIAEGFAQYSIALFEEYRYNRIGFGTSLQREISPQTRGDLGLSVYTENVYNVPEDLVIGQDDLGVTFYSLLRGSMQYDRRDDRFNPRRGVLLGMQSEVSSALIGSEVNFWGLTTQTLGYYPLSSKVFLTSGARLSLYRPFSDTDVIPLSSRVFLGGRSSLRGFSRGAVGPRSKEGGIVGGDTGVNFSTEVQREVTSSVAGVVFLDMGQSVLANEGEFGGDNSDLWSLRYSPGVGLRYKTPIGPLSLDWGFALDREYGERYGRVTFGIGGVFY
jgi:outer membrane protein insertion porin family